MSGFFRCLVVVVFSLSISLEAKTVLITGATRGIGLEAVKTFRKKGWNVWAGYRSEIPEELLFLDNVNFCLLDVTEIDQIQKAVQKIIEQDGQIDVLINNAGYGLIDAEEIVDTNKAQELFDVNFFGVMRLVHEVAPHMRERKSGHILNISSTSGVRALGGLGVYAASKFALEGYSEGLAVTLSPWNIHVSIVEPGNVNNDWLLHCACEKGEKEEIYSNLQEKLFNKLDSLVPTGQSCVAIAELLLEIAESDNPHMRYQTSEKVLDVVKMKFVDPTGDQIRDHQIQFFQSLIILIENLNNIPIVA